jgi:hypothetical protein
MTGGNIVPIAPPMPGLRQKVDRVLQSVWTPPVEPTPNPDDTVLLAAAWEFRRLQRLSAVLDRGRTGEEPRALFRATERELARLDDRWNLLFDFIHRVVERKLKARSATGRSVFR